MDVALGHTGHWWPWQRWGRGLGGFFQPDSGFYIMGHSWCFASSCFLVCSLQHLGQVFPPPWTPHLETPESHKVSQWGLPGAASLSPRPMKVAHPKDTNTLRSEDRGAAGPKAESNNAHKSWLDTAAPKPCFLYWDCTSSWSWISAQLSCSDRGIKSNQTNPEISWI